MAKRMTVEPHQFFLSRFAAVSVPEVIIEIVDVITAIYLADITTKRASDVKRHLYASVYVHNEILWQQCIPILKDLVSFVSGDELTIIFNHRVPVLSGLALDITQQGSNITLLSGGLDSYCGAYIDSTNKHNSHYVSYKNNNAETSSQRKLIGFLSRIQRVPHYQFPRLYANKVELTQRTRCLLYLSLAVLACGISGINNIKVYENGILSLNPSFI